MKDLILIVVLFFCVQLLNAQSRPAVSEEDLTYDYFSHEYQFLNEDYQIEITTVKFDEIVKKYKFYPEMIRSYKDSLAVVLAENFNGDWGQIHVGRNRLSYSWSRLSYHLWKTPEQTKVLANNCGYTHPYLFKEYLLEDNDAEQVRTILEELKENLANKLDLEVEFNSLSSNELLSLAMRNSPNRIKKLKQDAYFTEHGEWPGENTRLGESCGKENCCQTR